MLRARYGPDAVALYDALYTAQGGACAICGQTESVLQRSGGNVNHLAMDHSAITGRVRGLLCFTCNRALGSVGDEIEGVMRFVEYLRWPPAERNQPCLPGFDVAQGRLG